MAGITTYERMRRQLGEGAIVMVHHIHNKYTKYFFKTEMTTKTMEEWIELMGGAKTYEPVRTYYIALKQNPEDWERQQHILAQTDEPQKQRFTLL